MVVIFSDCVGQTGGRRFGKKYGCTRVDVWRKWVGATELFSEIWEANKSVHQQETLSSEG